MSDAASNLAQRAVRGGVYTFGAQGARFVCQLLSIIVLARFVAPEDFGLIGMLASFLGVLQLFRDLGLSVAIVQIAEISERQLNALFRFSLLVGVAMFGLVYAAACALAWFVDDERLIGVAPFYALMFSANAFGSVPLGLLRRRLQFGRIAVRDALSAAVSVVVGIVVAVRGGGYWALVAMALTAAVLNLVLTWTAAGWKPGGKAASLAESLHLLKFGGTFTLGEIASYLSQNLDKLLIGKIWGFQALGFYTRAYALMLQPMNQFLSPLGSVLIPVLSRLNEDREAYERWVVSLFGYFLFCAAPLSAFLLVGADELVPLLLGDGWERTADILFWLVISFFGKPVSSLLYWVFVSTGNVRQMVRWTVANLVLSVTAVSIGVIWGPVVVAAAFSVTGCLIRTPLAIYFAARTERVSFAALLKHYLLGLAWFGMWLLAMWGGDRAVGSTGVGNWLHLAILGIAGGLVVMVLLTRTRRGREMVHEIRLLLQPRYRRAFAG